MEVELETVVLVEAEYWTEVGEEQKPAEERKLVVVDRKAKIVAEKHAVHNWCSELRRDDYQQQNDLNSPKIG